MVEHEDPRVIAYPYLVQKFARVEKLRTAEEMRRVTVLYRPVGEAELGLIVQAESRRFPKRLPEQPIFYPVVTEEYASQIAREWNARDGQKGYVTRFAIETDYIDRFQPQQVGARIHTEYWIPADELDEFNEYIVGTIEVIASFGDDD